MALRAKQAAEILGVSISTIRNWCEEGRLEYSLSAAGQRIFDEQYLKDYVKKVNGIQEPKSKLKWFYVRSSNGSDVLMETQQEKLTEKYGTPDKIFKDKASGLNENRKGLNSLLKTAKETSEQAILYVTNKDRLTRFGFNYIEQLLNEYDVKVVVMDSQETKEPHEVLIEDFMSLLASFSGKFYRLRGWEQQRKMLNRGLEEVEERESNAH